MKAFSMKILSRHIILKTLLAKLESMAQIGEGTCKLSSIIELTEKGVPPPRRGSLRLNEKALKKLMCKKRMCHSEILSAQRTDQRAQDSAPHNAAGYTCCHRTTNVVVEVMDRMGEIIVGSIIAVIP